MITTSTSSRAPAKSLPKAIAITGPSGAGKTELICRLLDWFKAKGLKVAVLKHTHKTDLGDNGKDTWRYRQAGAGLVALAGPGLLQITRYAREDPPLAAVLAALAPEADLILVEGYKSSPLPKLWHLGPESAPPPGETPGIIALVSPEPLPARVPVFQPHQVAEIARFIHKYLDLA